MSSNFSIQVYYTVDTNPGNLPVWMFNDRVEVTETTTGWLHLPVELQHPLQTPDSLKCFAVVLRQTGPPEQVVAAAIKNGCYLTLAQIRSLHATYKFPMVSKPHGSGKNGNVVKKDCALALIRFFHSKASEKEQNEMLRGIMGKNWRHLQAEKVSRHSSDILKAFNGMDYENQPEWVDLVAVAADEEILKDKRNQAPRPTDITKSEQKYVTPGSLKVLQPKEANCRITRHPQLKRYQAFYNAPDKENPSTLSAKQLIAFYFS